MAAPHHEFASTDHLGTEAVAAFVDGELSPSAHRRAQEHLLACGECRREVARQRQAARRLRDSSEVHIPADLRKRLASMSRDQMPENAPGARRLSHRRPDSLAAFVESAWRTLRKSRNGQ
ncbi:zf-HC2 domain-containing protein [Corynebacterium hansenii]|uniref:Zf-HC2 domain-containing protein n=1 Tax=Corynebacterium hansenii TaxID=394964 RepID=A0ABV7ZKF3_9CORY|nr:zf-HC2 domain-containing protein [Corynebacterium hansenii]WJY99505.1 Anti-sigma-E factor RseA [Corynebacterium hansenii]